MEENPGNLIRGLRQKLGMTHAEPSKLAWKAIQNLAHKRGVTDDVLRGSGMAVEN